jgi:hypothetical protein
VYRISRIDEIEALLHAKLVEQPAVSSAVVQGSPQRDCEALGLSFDALVEGARRAF